MFGQLWSCFKAEYDCWSHLIVTDISVETKSLLVPGIHISIIGGRVQWSFWYSTYFTFHMANKMVKIIRNNILLNEQTQFFICHFQHVLCCKCRWKWNWASSHVCRGFCVYVLHVFLMTSEPLTQQWWLATNINGISSFDQSAISLQTQLWYFPGWWSKWHWWSKLNYFISINIIESWCTAFRLSEIRYHTPNYTWNDGGHSLLEYDHFQVMILTCKFGDGDVDIFRPGPDLIWHTARLEKNNGLFKGEKLTANNNTVNMKILPKCIGKVNGKTILKHRQLFAGVHWAGWSLIMASCCTSEDPVGRYQLVWIYNNPAPHTRFSYIVSDFGDGFLGTLVDHFQSHLDASVIVVHKVESEWTICKVSDTNTSQECYQTFII